MQASQCVGIACIGICLGAGIVLPVARKKCIKGFEFRGLHVAVKNGDRSAECSRLEYGTYVRKRKGKSGSTKPHNESLPEWAIQMLRPLQNHFGVRKGRSFFCIHRHNPS